MQHERIFRVFVFLFFNILFISSCPAQSNQTVDTTGTRKNSERSIHKDLRSHKSVSLLTSDQLIKEAKIAAFRQNNYPKAKTLLHTALRKSPNDAEVKIFLARIYGWTDNYDSAKMYFEQVLLKNPKTEEASVPYADFEYFLHHNDKALYILNASLKYHPKSQVLLARKEKVLVAINNSGNKIPVEKDLAANKTEDTDSALNNQVSSSSSKSIDTEKSIATAIENTPANLDTSSSDDLIILARKAAFEDKNYSKAKGYLYAAYRKSPTYTDVQIFLGRIYTWTDNYDSARYFFEKALRLKPDYEDAINAYSDMEYYDNHYSVALALVDSGLKYHPRSEDLLLRKAKFMLAMKQYNQANSTIDQLLKINYKNAAAIQLHDKIKELSVRNDISVGYDFSYFNKQFANPWHLLGLEYGRVTDLGKIIARVNLANRFSSNGAQFEMDAYPHISKTFYAYLNFGVPLTNNGIFPVFRGGFSLYANLPSSFEGEVGFRYLKFSGNPVIIYTAGLGKYVKNWLFNEKVYLVPSDYSHTISVSFTSTASYYIGGSSADDVVGGSIGYGISPDDRANNIQLNTKVQRLVSYKVGLFYKRKISKFDMFSLSQGLVGTEYLPGVRGIEYLLGLSVTHKF